MIPTRWGAIASRSSIFALFLFCSLVSRMQAQGAAGSVNSVYCVASHIGERAEYFSEIFSTKEDDPSILGGAFKTYLTQSHSIPSWGGGCYIYSTDAVATQAKQEKVAELTKGRWVVKETGWKYTASLASNATPGAGGARQSPSATPSKEYPSACQLIPNTALESILGYQYGAPKIVKVDEDGVPFADLRIVASSSCQYVTSPEGKGGVQLTVWYTKDTDPVVAKDFFIHYIKDHFAGQEDVTGPDFPYPAVFRSLDSGTYVFKGGPNGVMILRVSTYLLPQDRTSGAEVIIPRGKKIALKILGTPSLASSGPRPDSANKSKLYWQTYYKTDLIRQVYEGHFAGDSDSSRQFKMLFTSYVEAFSSHCSATLPAHYDAIKITSQRTGQTSTVEVDPRFAPKYQQYFRSLINGAAQSPADALAIASGRVSVSDYLAPSTDVDKFFEIEKCQSGPMRQFGEGLLHAAHE